MTLFSKDFSSRREMIDYANGRASQGSIVPIDPRHLTDEQFIEISDGSTAVQFTADLANDGVSAGQAYDASGLSDGDIETHADRLLAAINAHAFNVTATKVGSGDATKLELNNDAVGENNVTITQGVQGGAAVPFKFKVEGMSGGAAAIVTTDIIRIMEKNDRWILFWM